MSSASRFASRLRRGVEDAVEGQPVLAIGMLATVGATRSSKLMLVLPTIALTILRDGRRRAPGFPVYNAVAVTQRQLIFFAPWRGFRLRYRAATFERQDISVSTRPPSGKWGSLPIVVIDRVADTSLEFELRTASKFSELNATFCAELGLEPARAC